MQIEIHLEGRWHPCATIQPVGLGGQPGDPVRLRYDVDHVRQHLGARDHRALSVRAPVDFGLRELSCWPSVLVDLLPQGAARRRLERAAQSGLGPWQLLERGAVNPVGNLRIRPAEAAVTKDTQAHPGFTLPEMVDRGDAFVDHALAQGAAVAGATDTQGDAPKFWVAQDEAGAWHPDDGRLAFLPRRHALLKFPVPEAGARAADILRHEAIYQRIAQACGLRVTETLPTWHEGALLIPRFDRRMQQGREIRLGVESLYSVAGIVDASLSTLRHDEVLVALAGCVSDFPVEFQEYVRRDLLNLALGNRDNHGRNTAVVKDIDGRMALAPIYDFGPSFLDARALVRVIRWDGEGGSGSGWRCIADRLDIRFEEAGLAPASTSLRAVVAGFLPRLVELPRLMADVGCDEDLIARRVPEISRLCKALEDIA